LPKRAMEEDDKGKFVGVTSGGETVKADKVIGDPSYFVDASGKDLLLRDDDLDRVRVVRIRDRVPQDADRANDVALQDELTRSGSAPDIYVAEVSSTHNVCAKDVYVAMVSTIRACD
jgi:Rab GDP dissociation inhibitor